jgi:ABC-type multidrug transport system ATPase subunit
MHGFTELHTQVICTIHQPSPATYALFDKLLLLAEGRVIYFGPSRDVVNYFITSPFQFPYQAGSNPANYLSK